MAGDVPEEREDAFRGDLRAGGVELGGSFTPISLALAMSAGPMPLPSVLRLWPTTSGSIVHSGTGRAFGVAHVFGSRGVSSENT